MKKRDRRINSEMMESIRMGERPRFPDGSRLPRRFTVIYAPNTGEGIVIKSSLRQDIRKIVSYLRGDRRTIRLAPDYGVDIPLWPQSKETEALFSPDLLAKLAAWQTIWNTHCHYETGWDQEELEGRWLREGEHLASEIRRVLPKRMKLKTGF